MPTEAQITQILESGAIGVAILLGIAVVVLALAFSKVVDFLSGFFKQLIEINSNLAKQAEATRRAVEANAEADARHATSIDANTKITQDTHTNVISVRTDVHTLQDSVKQGFDTTATKKDVDAAAVRIIEKVEPILERLDNVEKVIARKIEEHDKDTKASLEALRSVVDAARIEIINVVRDEAAKATQTVAVVNVPPQSVTPVTPPVDKDETISDRKDLKETKS